ncbi:hypothetical protein D3C83_263630 [compost metagenome]
MLPIADLAGSEPAQPVETYVVTDTLPPSFFAERFDEPELWVDARGAWLSSGARTLWLPLP